MEKMKEMQDLLRKIPKGKITTYGILAKKLKVHPRVMGRMLSKNDSDAPCYKVIRSNGSLGGYTSKRGVKDKIKKLRRDGIEIKNNRINLNKYLFGF